MLVSSFCSIRTARIVTRSCDSCSSDRVSRSSALAVSTRVGEVQLPDGFPQERRLARLRLDHQQRSDGMASLERDCRRPAARTDVEHARVRTECGARGHGRAMPVEVAGHHQRLDKQPVDGLVWGVLQREGGEVDLLVPELEQTVVGAERLNEPGGPGVTPALRARFPSRSLNSRGVMAEPVQIGADHRHRRRRHPWNAARLAERRGSTSPNRCTISRDNPGILS